ncbi:MAG: acyl-CoA dehydrogenase family protein [Deltaproteobacteria bacterium]|nr:acyl-CoA dehydrogenase family protein [Deltaproteobacteria bacterium]MBI3390015.1 acyl-CoA dehydrogenase family protein [Deltaproteobacteria bacterium]
MADVNVRPIDLAGVESVVTTTDALVREALDVARMRTDGGKGIDDEQVHCERLAYAATEVAAARDLLAYAKSAAAQGHRDPVVEEMAAVFAAEVAQRVSGNIDAHAEEFGIGDSRLNQTVGESQMKALLRAGLSDARIRAIGRHVVEQRGANHSWLGDEMAVMTRDSVRQFAESEVAPIAEHIHRHDDLIPESIIAKMSELGFFGMSVPEEFGGGGMGNLAMILTTEELSRCSLAAAGSLITRPEILTKALLKGGTDAQKQQWLPPIAAGQIMVGISVTEPDTGSDVASVKCRADAGEVGGKQKGYVINGAKAWCTFAGRANVLALLARTDPDLKKGARGLSLFIVPKDAFTGHEFEMKQSTGGVLVGKADRTPGYRGMHSYTLNFDSYFVAAENLVGEEGGLNKGFYLQMNGFAAGRLQTGGRATGVAQAALECTAAYANDRKQFGQPIGSFHLTQHKLGRMATHIMAARQLTYAAALAMDADESIAIEPAMAKLFASDVAVWTTQEGQLIHGGWGYAEEFAISRYVVDAQVLPIFEGVKPILELKVIARNLLGS